MTVTAPSPKMIDDEAMKKTDSKDRLFLTLLVLGIVVRVAAFFAAGPFNADDHFQVIRWIADHGSIPRADLLGQSHHPPLYHLLMALIWKATGSISALHFVSLLLSIANLLLLSRLIRRVPLFGSRFVRCSAMGFASLLPQFVMFSSFVSNDSLTLLLGTLVFVATLDVTGQPTMPRVARLAAWIGLGMATKGTFLLTGVALVPIVIAALRAHRQRIVPAIAIFCLIWLVLGGTRYVDNTVRVGRPLVHNLDSNPDWARQQNGVWRGWTTVADVNVLKLVRHPILQPRNPYSYPLLMYGTFWFPHVPDSTFRGNVRGYAWVGSTLYALAIVPTLAFCVGFFQFGRDQSRNDKLVILAAILLILSNAMVVIGAGIKFDVWSCFQSRLCFQSMGPALLLFALGAEYLRPNAISRRVIDGFTWATLAICLLYFAIELGITSGVLPASEQDLPVYQSSVASRDSRSMSIRGTRPTSSVIS